MDKTYQGKDMRHYIRYVMPALLLLLSPCLHAQKNPLLTHVPADTVFFSGNTELVNMADFPLISPSVFPETVLTESQGQGEKAFAFLYQLFLDLQQTINASDTQSASSLFQTQYGLSPIFAGVFYLQENSPVIKVWVADESTFLQTFERASRISGLNYQLKSYQQQSYRSYALEQDLQLIVAFKNSPNSPATATLALIHKAINEQQLSLILGLSKPEQSLADTDKLSGIMQQNHYLPQAVSFVDFELLVQSLFKHNKTIGIDLAQENSALKEFRTAECQADLTTLIHYMPRLTGGYSHFKYDGSQVDSKFKLLLELNNPNVMAELKSFRGFIPAYIRNGAEQNIVGMGLGLDLSQLSSMYFYISQAFKNTHFQCKPLLKMQKKIARTNPAMVALMTGVAEGIHGIAFAVQKMNVSQKPFELSMIMSIAAENPLRVWQLLAGFNSATAGLTPSQTPQRISHPVLDAAGIPVSLAIKGQHLVLYSGQPAAQYAEALGQEKITGNGLIQETINYSELLKVIKALKQLLNVQEQKLPAQICIYFDETINQISRISGTSQYKSDIVPRGWENSLQMQLGVAAQQIPSGLTGKFRAYNVGDGCQLEVDGIDEINTDGSGLYHQYSEDQQCFVYETQYRWTQRDNKMQLQYISERNRPEGLCDREFTQWSVPEAAFINDSCDLRVEPNADFACVFHWNNDIQKSVFERLQD